MPFKKILVPYDGSKPSDDALRQAAALAKAVKCEEIVLLHVVKEIPVPPMMYDYSMRSSRTGEEAPARETWKELHQDMKDAALKMLEEKRKKLGADGPVVRTMVAVGYPADKIIEVADSEKVDLIVMGNVGRTGLSRLMALGSVSRTVSEKARCPVMIVH